MPSGIQIFNDSGTVLIDENYSNLCMHTKGSATLSASAGTPTTVTGAWSARAVVAVTSGSQVYASIVAGSLTLIGAASASVTYYVFDVPTAPYSTFGLVVYNAAGVVTFDAAKQYARVISVREASTSGGWAGAVAYAAGRTYAVAFLRTAFQNQTTWTKVGDPGSNEYRVDVNTNYASVAFSGTTATYGYGPTSHKEFINTSGGFSAYTTEKGALTAAVIDVTGY